MRWEIILKYFLHGILFSVILLLLELVWAFAVIFLVGLGFIIGFIIGLGLLFLIIGFINMSLGVYLWNIQAEIRFWDIFLHGLVLFVVLLIVGLITDTLLNYAFSGIVTLVLTFILRTFLNGVIGRYVASWFEEGILRTEENHRRTEELQLRL